MAGLVVMSSGGRMGPARGDGRPALSFGNKIEGDGSGVNEEGKGGNG